VVVHTSIVFYTFYVGSVQSPDTATFITWAKALTGHKFNLFAYYSDVSFHVPPLFYTVPTTIFAIFMVVFNEYWVMAYLILNLIAVFFVLFLYVKIALYLNIRKGLVVLSLLVFLVSVDFLLWPRYILTDTIFAALVMLTIYTVIVGSGGRTGYYMWVVLLSVILLFSRPSSSPVITTLLFFVFMERLSQRLLIKKTLFLRLSVLTLFSSALYSTLIMASTAGIIESNMFEFWRSWIERGVVINARPETYITYEASFLGAAKLHIYRFVGFFTPFARDFSLTHNVLNGLLLLGSYIIIFALFPYSFIDFESNNSRATAIALISTLIVVMAISTSAILIDYDWRYRYPVIAPLIFLATLIFDNFINSRKAKISLKSE
jgi:hypothetical protein